MNNKWKRPVISVFAIVFLFTLFASLPGVLFAETEASKSSTSSPPNLGSASPSVLKEPYYYDALRVWKEKGILPAAEQIAVPASRFAARSQDFEVRVGTYEGASDALIIAEPKGWVEYEIEAARDGLYELWVEYAVLDRKEGGSWQPLAASVTWNGEYPFLEARSANLPRKFIDRLPEKYDENGYQVRSLIDELNGWQKEPFRDTGGVSATPLLWPAKKGRNVVRIEASLQPFAVKAVTLKPAEVIPYYRDSKPSGSLKSPENIGAIVLEAEKMAYKSSTSILARYDRDPLTTPKSLDRIRFNTLGGPNWSKGGQTAAWEFTVPADGLYKIALRANQSIQKNLSVFRTITIDGMVPFQEMLHYPFRYRTGWSNFGLENEEGAPYEFYFTKGKHVLQMTATNEPYMPILIQIDVLSAELRSVSLDIRAATGNREDRFRVWDVQTDMPWLIERLSALEKQLRQLSEQMVALNGTRDNVSQAFLSAAKDLAELLRDPNDIPNSYLNLGTMQQKLDSQRAILLNSPLQVDKIYVVPSGGKFPRMAANWLEKIRGTFSSLKNSFQNRNQFGKQRDDELNVWMMWGRDYVDALQQLADEQFTPKYGIKVRINLVQSADLLILGQAAGVLPDVALGVPSEKPFELAIRDAALDISELSGGKQILAKFNPGTLLPYQYRGGTYALPETMNHKVLIYRKDILRQLKLTVPNTWDDVYRMLPTLLQNNYNFYADPADFTSLFFQNGAKLYGPDGLTTALNQPASFNAFKQWTDLFNKHGLERQVASFYNNFRRGTMPVGIADFNQYMQLLVAAPEIMNEWGIAPVPGTLQRDGTITRWIGGVQTVSSMLFKQIPGHKKDEAWEFLKWYLSDEVQTAYGTNLEQYGGETFRWNSANVKAFVNMPWRPEDLNVFLEQWQWYQEVPNVPGGYMTTRELAFAWNRAAVSGDPLRPSLEKAVKEINRELSRKQREFNLVQADGEASLSLELPQITQPWKGAISNAK